MTESHIHYLYTDKPGSQILPARLVKNIHRRATFLTKTQVDDLDFYLKLHSSTDALHTPHQKKNNCPVSSKTDHWNGLKCVDVTYAQKVI